MKVNLYVFMLASFLLFCSIFSVNAQEPIKFATAIRVNPEPPKIDGILDDEVWRKAPIHEGFLQRNPNEGEEATERTTFQIVYDDEAIYFGINCYDSEPNKIVSRLTRRDGWIEADWVSVSLDPHCDRQSGCWFAVYASGAVRDGVYSDDRSMDDTWNGVWEVKTKTHESGWSAEYKIPYHVLRFSPKDEYIWGLNVERNITRKKERSQWMLNRRDKPGLVSKFGRLEGIHSINPPMHLELMPYVMGRSILADERDLFGSIGADIRYGITSNISLNATINPDFGQVEADPSRLNLTAFEDFYPERRPFFVEGSAIFRNWDYSLLHSRRIGGSPRYFSIPEGAEELERPKETTILGAAKLTGKTDTKTTFGILEAVTAPEYATIKQADGKETDHLIEPLTNYFVGRLIQDVLDGTSKVGLMTTAVNRKEADAAYAGAFDWALKFRKETLEFSGTMIGSLTEDADAWNNGYISHFEFDKRGGWLEAEIGASAISPGFDINDLGFIRRNNMINSWGSFSLIRNKPLSIIRSADISCQGSTRWNYDGLNVGKGFDISYWGEFLNYWEFHAHYGRDFESFNDDYVRWDGPVIKRPSSYFAHTSIRTDSRRVVNFSFRPEMSSHDNGLTYMRGLNFGVEFRPLTNVWLLMEPSYRRNVIYAQWIGRFEEDSVRYVYGELDNKTLDFTTRARFSFTPGLSLEFFIQPFITIGDYENFKELVAEKTYDFKPYSLNENRDYHRRSLKSNVVLRWEFRPGSTLFLVWSQSRSSSLEEVTLEDLEFRPFDRLISSFSDDGSNVFLVKLNYWLGI